MPVFNYVRQYRRKLGMTQEKLSEISGIGRTTISNIETERYIPGVDVALRLAKALNTRVENLFQIIEIGDDANNDRR